MACQCLDFLFRKTRLHNVDLAGKFGLRQGLWIEDLRTPPGQECSNGSLILLAVVPWRTFSMNRDRLLCCALLITAAMNCRSSEADDENRLKNSERTAAIVAKRSQEIRREL